MSDPLNVEWTVFECEQCHTPYPSDLSGECVLP